jgi:hypothetical protein
MKGLPCRDAVSEWRRNLNRGEMPAADVVESLLDAADLLVAVLTVTGVRVSTNQRGEFEAWTDFKHGDGATVHEAVMDCLTAPKERDDA